MKVVRFYRISCSHGIWRFSRITGLKGNFSGNMDGNVMKADNLPWLGLLFAALVALCKHTHAQIHSDRQIKRSSCFKMLCSNETV